ncbi:uncharacterized protein LOC126895426 [Daktulosphaira vitifoliae]|uniref:uncharacterized protein LOC126895426 n=1 Tax=Daktulosphaira vitifoliae TaxID=58002 RepID=UPI0021AA3336|nr:uncharacterized protein LOC126895426 [Daktulosphaira vitifoliae]
MFTGLRNACSVNGVGISPLNSRLDSCIREKDRYKGRIGTWNVVTLTGKSRESVEVLKRRKVNICCVQETKWKRDKWREIGEGYKIIYSGKSSTKNDVGIIMDEEMKSKVVEVTRNSDRIIVVKLIFEKKVLNVISAYVQQVGCDEIDKEVFWREMDEVMQGCPDNENAMIGGDMNGHVGNERRGYERVHEGYGFSGKNEAGKRILDFAVSYDLAMKF